MWKRASVDEKKMLLKDFLYGVTVDRDGDDFQATYHVWTIPGLGKEIAPAPYFAGGPGQFLPLKSVAGVRLALYRSVSPLKFSLS
jgi:hypothetical protein